MDGGSSSVASSGRGVGVGRVDVVVKALGFSCLGECLEDAVLLLF